MRTYQVTESVNDEPGRLDGEVVDAEFVASYTDIETRRFFINLGGVEEIRKTKTGTIVCKSTDPDGQVRVIRFCPLPYDSGARP